MAILGSPCSLIFAFLLLSAVGITISKTTRSTIKGSQVSPMVKCQKVEELLYEIKRELGEMREDIKSLKENKTTGKGS